MIFKHLNSLLNMLLKQSKYAWLNIIGLTIGLVAAMYMIMLIDYESSYDKFHYKNEIFQICINDLKSGERISETPLPMPGTLRRDFPEVKNVVGISNIPTAEIGIKYKQQVYFGFKGAVAGKEIFDIFNYQLVSGNPKTIFQTFQNVLISQSLARKIFGTNDPLGQVIQLDQYKFTIEGIFKDVRSNTSVKFDILFPELLQKQIVPDYEIAWWNSGTNTFVILHEGVSPEQFNKKLSEIPGKYFPDFLKGRETFFAVPLTKTHLDTSLLGGLAPHVSPVYLMLLSLIVALILAIACINFINLSTGLIVKRSIDTGIRKVSGASKTQIIIQHTLSGLTSSLIAFIIAIPLLRIGLGYFEQLVQRDFSYEIIKPGVWLIGAGITLVIGFFTGVLPGLFYARMKPVSIFRKQLFSASSQIRTPLVIAQFTISIALIIGIFFVYKQIHFMQNADLGFNNNNLISVAVNHSSENHRTIYEKVKILRNDIEKRRSELGLSIGSITENIPGYYYQNSFTINPVKASVNECLVVSTAVDENFAEVFDVKMADGRYFSADRSTDYESFIINETAAKILGWKNAEGNFIKLFGSQPSAVIGIMKDMNITSLKEPIKPMIYRFGQYNNFPGFLTFRFKNGSEGKVIAFLKKEWEKFFPDLPFEYLNVKETYFKNYVEEKRILKIVGCFSILAILLSCFGLFGLIAFYTESRTKEIGIRKINGSSTIEILVSLLKDSSLWVFFAFLIATPIAWYAINKWLQNFAFKTTLSFWVFIIAGLIAIIISTLTVLWHSWKAANKNPAESLRYE